MVDARSITDCVFFKAGHCQKGSSCLFRHSESSISAKVCNLWINFCCEDVNCKESHPTLIESQTKTCNFFLIGRCKKSNCRFSHDISASYIKADYNQKESACDKNISLINTKRSRDILSKYSNSFQFTLMSEQDVINSSNNHKLTDLNNKKIKKVNIDDEYLAF